MHRSFNRLGIWRFRNSQSRRCICAFKVLRVIKKKKKQTNVVKSREKRKFDHGSNVRNVNGSRKKPIGRREFLTHFSGGDNAKKNQILNTIDLAGIVSDADTKNPVRIDGYFFFVFPAGPKSGYYVFYSGTLRSCIYVSDLFGGSGFITAVGIRV